jgi:5-methylcytosine-specific restriction endonuclease McrBC regulatory subunit McrC
MCHKFVTDNCSSKDISNWNDVTINSLKTIGNKSLIDLQKDNDNLLIFPTNFKEYGDDIEKSHIFNIFSDNKLQTHNLMGFVGIDNVQLTIGSRFDEDKNKQYFLQYMLHKVFAINMVDLKTKADNENIWDFLLMFMFPYFLNNALRQGIYKEYRKKKNNDFNVKGTIDIARHIKQNIPFMGKVAYNTREFGYDNSTTQLIRHTAEYIIQKGFRNALNPNSESIENVNIIRKATPAYNIRDRQKVISKNYKNVNHPFFTEYEPLRNICMRILRYEGVSMENSENKVHGLLFDGAWLWEEYLNTILKDCGFEHPENKTKKNGLPLFESSQKIYPDFYKKKPNIVIDAKYKKLQNYDNLTTGDLYQVITYMYRLQANKGVLLYPLQKNDVQEKNKVVQFNMNKDSYGGVKAIFEKYGMLIPQAKNEYQEFVMEINKHEKELQKDIID